MSSKKKKTELDITLEKLGKTREQVAKELDEMDKLRQLSTEELPEESEEQIQAQLKLEDEARRKRWEDDGRPAETFPTAAELGEELKITAQLRLAAQEASQRARELDAKSKARPDKNKKK